MRLPFTKRPPLSNQSSNTALPSKKSLFRLVRAFVGGYLCIFFGYIAWYPSNLSLGSHENPFRVEMGEAPVLNSTGDLKFLNTPVSSWRPQNQFFSSSRWSIIEKVTTEEPAILTVITVTNNAREVMKHTSRFILEQSLLPIRWLIVNDHTDLKQSYQMLQHIASLDRRFHLVNSTREPGFSNGRMYALDNLLRDPTKYFAFLDDDDYFEYTAYEKCVWLLESNANASMCGTYVVGFGDRDYTWEFGFHNGYNTVVQNPLTGSEILRTSILDTDCVFDTSLQSGMEDWDFYLCLASRGLWGVTIPEYLFWYRINPESFRKERWGSLFEDREEMSKEIRERYKQLEFSFPHVHIDSTKEFEAIDLSPPIKNELNLQKSFLMIISDMSNGDGNIANLRLVQRLSAKGYRVTIVCSLLNLRGDFSAFRPYFMQYTHDIFTIPAIIRLADAPRFLAYLIRSRNVQTVLISNSQLGYGVLPWLSVTFPDVIFADYVHSKEPDWMNGGYATLSRIHQTSLDATFTSSETVRAYMIEQGHEPSAIEVGNFGLDLQRLHPLQDEKQAAARFIHGIPPEATVVLLFARTVAFDRPKMAAAAFLQVAKGVDSKLMLLVIGDGPVMEGTKRLTAPHGNIVKFLGDLRHSAARKYLELSDIFCLPSPSKEISFALTDSREMGLTALTSSIGGYPEMLLQNTSSEVILPSTGQSKSDVSQLADALNRTVYGVISRMTFEKRALSRPYDLGEAHDKLSAFVDRLLGVKRTRSTSQGAHSGLSALHNNLLPVLRDEGVFSDFPEIHRIMKGKARSSYGIKYRAVCKYHNDMASRLLDLLENPKACKEGQELDIKKMKAAALSQCGRWCIMDLGDPKRQSGWQAKESCQGFEPFDDPAHSCSTWFKALSPEKKY